MPDAQTPSAAKDSVCCFLTFRLDQRLYALPAEDVVEVIRTPQVARVPQAPKALIGIAMVCVGRRFRLIESSRLA